MTQLHLQERPTIVVLVSSKEVVLCLLSSALISLPLF